MLLQVLPVVLERGETALAQVVLDAQELAQAEIDEDSLPCLVWNDIRDSARTRSAVATSAPPFRLPCTVSRY
jgi:hypothetical protein